MRLALSLGILILFAPAGHAQARKKPNIIVIVADDLGFGDISVHGCKDIQTPHIDSIARNGIRCTQGYVSGVVCSPTRAGLLTGRYQQRFGHEFNPGPPSAENEHIGLDLRHATLADLLRALGYRTGMVGKWHLGHAEKFMPTSRGFEEYFGFLGGAHSYFPGKMDKGATAIHRGTKPVIENDYLTDAFGREAVAFVERRAKEPFFLYLTFNAVHTPMHAADKYLARFKSIEDKTRRTYAAMLSAMDDAIGAVLTRLRELGLEDDTLIFFISDNGGPAANGSTNGLLRGRKGQTWEGGVHVPFLLQWKSRLPANKTYDQPVIQLDILPTCVAAAGGEIKADLKIDGVNLLPYLDGKRAGMPHEALFWRAGAQMAVRMGDWKLVKANDGVAKAGKKDPATTAGAQLFNLAEDPGEKVDLTAKHPDKVKELAETWRKWDAELARPAFKKVTPKKKETTESGSGPAANQALARFRLQPGNDREGGEWVRESGRAETP